MTLSTLYPGNYSTMVKKGHVGFLLSILLGSKYPKIRALGPADHGTWNLQPHYLGTWTLTAGWCNPKPLNPKGTGFPRKILCPIALNPKPHLRQLRVRV